jgi:hypothetical protein
MIIAVPDCARANPATLGHHLRLLVRLEGRTKL